MKRNHGQRGSGLVLVIGITAALAVMTTTAVALTLNVQNNTQAEGVRTKAFDTAEGALDVGMYKMNDQWPKSAATWTWDTAAQTDYRGMFSTTTFPNPPGGNAEFSSVSYYDNQPVVSGVMDTTVQYDRGGPSGANTPDGKMYLVAQSGVGDKASRIQVLVEQKFVKMGLPRGIALFTGGNLFSNGGGNNPKIVIDPGQGPPAGTQAAIRVSGTIDDPTVADQSKYAEVTGAAAGTAEDVFPPALITTLTNLAKAHNRYFDGASAITEAQNSPANGTWSSGGLTGLTVIEPTAAGTLALQGDYNSEATPGVLLLLGGSNLDFAGGGNYWGVVYTDGTVDKGHGNFVIHGMLVAKSTVDMRGTVNIAYNDSCISKLDLTLPSNVRIVANTWRELKPQ